MAQPTKAFIGFLVAPAIPGALLYILNLLSGVGDAAIFWPFILTSLGYIAALVVGVPVYLFLQRKGIHSLPAYVFAGSLIGLGFCLIFTLLTAYPGQIMFRLRHALGFMLTAMVYASVAAAVFWTIAVRPETSIRQGSA
jgi:hypothetical protein